MTAEQVRIKLSTVFSPLTFNEERHLYFWHGVRVEKSITRIVSEHAEPFDADYWAPKCIAKEGVLTAHEVKHIWQTKSKEGCEIGHETHDYMEYYNGLKYPNTPQKKAGVKYLIDMFKDYEIVCREFRMYSIRYKFAGTADILIRHKITGELFIIDYKTNKDLFKSYGMLLAPFQSMISHPFAKYQLQLSYYQIMLEDIGIKISGRIVVHLMADENYKTYPCFDFTNHLRKYLN